MVGQRIQNRLDFGPVPARGCVNAQPRQISRPKGVLMEKPVQVAACHPTIGADRTFGLALHQRKRTSAIGSITATNVDLITFNRHTAGNMGGGHARKALHWGHHGFHIKKPQPRRVTCRAFYALGV